VSKVPGTLYHPYQPYFEVMDNFYLEQKQYIKHNDSTALFYQFKIDSTRTGNIFAVPDGCIDILFERNQNNPKANICGPVKKPKKTFCQKGTEYFGVRFYPGKNTNLFNCSPMDFVDKEIDLTDIIVDGSELIDVIVKRKTILKEESIILPVIL